MKRLITILAAVLLAADAGAMSYDQARERALFLADKMAYELNLTDEQYEACYEVNLDYFMSIGSADDLYGDYWLQRNLDLGYILLDWQYNLFLESAYFYRPFYFLDNVWHFAVYTRYPHRDYFFFGRPAFWSTYRGGHSWRKNGNKSWYNGRTFAKKGTGVSNRSVANGMRDKFNKGDYGRGQTFNNDKNSGRGQRVSGNNSSTRVTAGGSPSGTKAGSTNRNSASFNNTATKQNATAGKTNTSTARPATGKTGTTSTVSSRPTSTSRTTAVTTSKSAASATKSNALTTKSTATKSTATRSNTTTSRPTTTTSRSTATTSRSTSTSRPTTSSATRSSSSATRSNSTATRASSTATRASSSSAVRSSSTATRASSSSVSRSSASPSRSSSAGRSASSASRGKR